MSHSYVGAPSFDYLDGPTVDAFGRLRTSQPFAQFAAFNEYNINPFNWVTYTTPASSATATHSTTTKMVTLSTGGTTSGVRSILQSRMYMRYTPGKSLFTAQTFVMGTQPGVNCEKRVGYYDDSNGFYLRYAAAGISLVRRSSVSGSVVETAILQSSWNVDKLDGKGPSGETLDLSKGQIFMIDFQYLGMGRVRLGFDIGGKLCYVHEFNHANVTANQPYIATANLPLRYEIINTGTAAQTETMLCMCGKVDSEGNIDLLGIQYAVSNGATGIATSVTLKPVISIRPGPTFNGITNRGWLVPMSAELFCTATGSVDHYYQIIWNATLTNANWQSVNASYSMAQYDVSSTAVSLGSGVIVEDGYVSSGGVSRVGGKFNDVFSDRPLVNSFDGTTPDTLTIAVRTLSGTGTGYGSFTWHGHW